MTATTIDEMRERIADFWEQDESIDIGETWSALSNKKAYELLWIPAKEEWLMISYNNDGQSGGVYEGFCSLKDHLESIEDELIIETYNEYVADSYDEEDEDSTE